MRLNIKVHDTGIEATDWEHIDNVDDIDMPNSGHIRYQKKTNEGGMFKISEIEYFHITEIEESGD